MTKDRIPMATGDSSVAYKTIGVIGVGYVGLPLAVAFGSYRKVIAYDVDHKRVEDLRNLKDSTLECTSDELEKANQLSYTSNINDLSECQIYIVTVPTPIDSAKLPDFKPLSSATKVIGSLLKPGDIVIYESTVYPGATEDRCVPILEEISGLTYNVDFFCGYSPERINPGDKDHGLTSVVKITSGSTVEVAEEVDLLYKEIVKAGTFQASSIKVAESAKIIENTQRDLNIAFFNELSLIFERMTIDTDEVIRAASTKWNFLPFKPGLVGGHCIGVDPYYLAYKAEELGYHPQLLLAGRRINDGMPSAIATRIIKAMSANSINISKSIIGFFGITFKDNCPDIRNSKAIELINELQSWGATVVVHDSWADSVQVESDYGIKLCSFDRTSKYDAIIIAVPHDEYKAMGLDLLKSLYSSNVCILGDLKSIYPLHDCLDKGFTVIRL